MKRVGGFVGALVLLAGLFVSTNVAAQSTDNFVISDYAIKYELSRDSESHSILKTTETITAEFPLYDQNHGIERALPLEYNGNNVDLRMIEVTDENGELLQHSTNSQGSVLILRIGDADKYVQGQQTYKITYSQRDVTRFYQNTGRDEWYWDTNGTEWRVPIENLSVTVAFSDDIASQRVGEPFCYFGASASTDRCDIQQAGSSGLYEASVKNVAPGQNVSLAFGFNQGTFAPYTPTLWEVLLGIWLLVLLVSSILGLIVFIALSVAYARRSNRTKELAIVPAEYIPPKDISVLISAQVLPSLGSVFGAQLIDLAIKRTIVIIETKPKSSFWSTAEYDIKILEDVSSLLAEEQEVLSDMFGHTPKVGEQISLKSLKNNTSYFTRTTDNDKKLKALVEGEYAIREKSPTVSKFFYRWSIAFVVFGLLTLSPFVLILAGIVALYGVYIRPLTDKGLALRRYLLGLKKYIKASEIERLEMFQSPETAEKVGESVDPSNAGQMLRLYERVLPYAILFGYQKEWSKRLGEYYETNQANPDWYSGNTAFNAVLFSSAINSFSTTVAYSSGASSSSGGSSGGGSSGGGGGGGGGGGW